MRMGVTSESRSGNSGQKPHITQQPRLQSFVCLTAQCYIWHSQGNVTRGASNSEGTGRLGRVGLLRLVVLVHYAAAIRIIFCSPEHNSKAQILRIMTIPEPTENANLVASNGVCTSAVSLLCDGQLDTLALWQRDPWLLRSDDENVVLTSCERVVYGILDVDNVEASIVTLTVSDDTNTTHVATTSDHGDNSGVELDVLSDLAGSEINLDRVVDLDGWVRVTDSSSIVRDQEWDSAFAQLHSLDFSELIFGLLRLDPVNGETAFGVVDQTEVLASLLDTNDVHEARWVGGISSNLAVDLDQALHDDGLGFTRVESIL